MKRFERGSEWRKWDLHVHVPGTKLSNGYEKKDGKDDWARFADHLESSDVSVFGITDYFHAAHTFEFIRFFRQRHPDSEKLLLPNVEFRLNETVNKAAELIHFHAIFSDAVSESEVTDFLGALQTQLTNKDGKKLTCSNLETNTHFTSASISRGDLEVAFAHAFGTKAVVTDKLIYLAPSNNDGIRAMKGNARKAHLADEVDKLAHAFFGGAANSSYFLIGDRYENKDVKAASKPVFSGCDSHSFDQLESWLGKEVSEKGVSQEITWVKADPTFEGLQQTLIEPEERVSIQASRPDTKEPYKVIRKVRFSGGDDFPAEIALNDNLNAIIGSRSSGKSALLAHIAHAIDPAYTVAQQVMASHNKASEVGPAAGRTWSGIGDTHAEVEWADGSTIGGSVIYVPQNWLYEISDNPTEVTAKIQPALELRYASFIREHRRQEESIRTANDSISRFVDKWFSLSEDLGVKTSAQKKLGDKAAILKSRDDLQLEIDNLRQANKLSKEDLALYQSVIGQIASKKSRVDQIQGEKVDLDPFVTVTSDSEFVAAPGAITVDIQTTPRVQGLPDSLGKSFDLAVDEVRRQLISNLESLVVAHRSAIEVEDSNLSDDRIRLETDNKALIEKHEANKALDDLVRRHKEQVEILASYDLVEGEIKVYGDQLVALEGQITEQITSRRGYASALDTNFKAEARVLDDLTFGIEMQLSRDRLVDLSEPFRKNETGTFLVKDGDDVIVDIEKALSDPGLFLRDMQGKKQKLNRGRDVTQTSVSVLTATPDIRFTAELEGDVIGGFEKSTMTPGKQALFALTLILNEAQDSWPLLIDQPEDDLDSRSIYSAIVPYLASRKKERQIILVTHNANLVIGADAEEVIVANRHGDDSRNRNSRTFDYLTGSLENSALSKSSYKLETMGVREHACDILDGGEEAFQKRAEKYKI